MDGFDSPRRQEKDNGRRRRPWDIDTTPAEGGGPLREEGKLVEFPPRPRPAQKKPNTDEPDALLAKLGEQRERLLSVRTELENASKHHAKKRSELERQRSEVEADIAEMRAALANVNSQIREVELIEEVVRELQRNE